MHQVARVEVRRKSTPALVLDDSHGNILMDTTPTPVPDESHPNILADTTPASPPDKSHADILADATPTPVPDDSLANILTDATPALAADKSHANVPTDTTPASVPYDNRGNIPMGTTPDPASGGSYANILEDTTPARGPDNSRGDVPTNTTPAPVAGDAHTNVLADSAPASPNVSAKAVEENKEHGSVKHKSEPRSLYQQPLEARSEPTLSTRNPEWELSRKRLAAQLVRLRHPFVLPQDDLSIHPASVSGIYDGHDTALAGPSLAVATINMPCDGGRACDNQPHYRRHECRSRNRSAATVLGQRAEVYAPEPVAPHGGSGDNWQDSFVSSEDAGVASGIVEAPVLRGPYDSGRSRGRDQRPKRWDQNVKQNRVHRWLWLVLPDLCIMLSLFLAAIYMDKRLKNFRWMTRRFPMTMDPLNSTWVGPVEISWPQERFIVSVLAAEILIPLVPTLILLAMQIWVRNFWDLNAAIFGLFKGIAIVYVASHPTLKLIEDCRKLFFKSEPQSYLGIVAKMHFRTLLQVILKSFIGIPSLDVSKAILWADAFR